MFETNVAVVGNAITEPKVRDTSGGRVASFRVVSTARRFDKNAQQWVDGDKFFATVNCWRRLGEGVSGSVRKHDPVVVAGRVRTREYEVAGQWRTTVEIEAQSVGFDLARKSSPEALQVLDGELEGSPTPAGAPGG